MPLRKYGACLDPGGEARLILFENKGGDGFDFSEHAVELDRGRAGGFNLDFADIRALMREMGKAMMGTGEAHGDHRAVTAWERSFEQRCT